MTPSAMLVRALAQQLRTERWRAVGAATERGW